MLAIKQDYHNILCYWLSFKTGAGPRERNPWDDGEPQLGAKSSFEEYYAWVKQGY
jgi:hypothetical protein